MEQQLEALDVLAVPESRDPIELFTGPCFRCTRRMHMPLLPFKPQPPSHLTKLAQQLEALDPDAARVVASMIASLLARLRL